MPTYRIEKKALAERLIKIAYPNRLSKTVINVIHIICLTDIAKFFRLVGNLNQFFYS